MPKLIPKEGKKINILTNDVHTYVRELISKEFESVKKEERAHSDNRKLINSRMRRAISSISDGDNDDAHRSSLPDGISNRPDASER